MSDRHGSESHDASLPHGDMIRLLTDHADDPAAELPGWQRALDAFDALDPDDLDDARALNEAFDADPLLLFRRLPAPELDEAELADVKRSVHELRRAKAIEAESAELAAPRSLASWRDTVRSAGRSAWRSGHLRLAAVLAVTVLSASLLLASLSNSPVIGPAVAEGSQSAVATQTAAAGAAVTFDDLGFADPPEDDLPLVENFAGDSELIQIEYSDMSLVVVASADRAVNDVGADRL